MFGRLQKMQWKKQCNILTGTEGSKRETLELLWISRINAGARINGMSYSQLMGKIKSNKIDLNRKVLADLAMNHPNAFKAIVDKVK